MTELNPSSPQDGPASTGPPAPEADGHTVFARIAVTSAGCMAACCAVAAVYCLAAAPGGTRTALACTAGGAVLIFIAGQFAVHAAARQTAAQVQEVRSRIRCLETDVQDAAAGLLQDQQPELALPPPARADGVFSPLVRDLDRARCAAGQALMDVAGRHSAWARDRGELFLAVSDRMQALVHRAIAAVDEMERGVEDPVLLKGLFRVDHLVTQLRHQVESWAVLGGSMSLREWGRDLRLAEVLRAAASEAEHYQRVKVTPPVNVMLRGSVAADVIHLLAELVDNATRYSAPATDVRLRAETVGRGVAVEVEDRGLGLRPDAMERLNALLADPSPVRVEDLLRQRRIGLYVVATLARQHGIAVTLRTSAYAGTAAVVVIPGVLLVKERDETPADGPAQAAGPALSAGVPPQADRRQETARGQAGRSAVTVPNGRPGPPGLRGPRTGNEPRPQAGAGPRPPLPVREPQASLAPCLRDDRRDGHRAPPLSARPAPRRDMPDHLADFIEGASDADRHAPPS